MTHSMTIIWTEAEGGVGIRGCTAANPVHLRSMLEAAKHEVCTGLLRHNTMIHEKHDPSPEIDRILHIECEMDDRVFPYAKVTSMGPGALTGMEALGLIDLARDVAAANSARARMTEGDGRGLLLPDGSPARMK